MEIRAGLALVACALAAQAQGAGPRPTSSASFERAVTRAIRGHSTLDRDGDGASEIASLRRIATARGSGAGGVLVLVEERLLHKPVRAADADLNPCLRAYVRDLGKAGFHVALAGARLYAGPRHQDGLIVLALRDLLRAIYKDVPDLRAVVMVGNFPTAFVVRQYYWPRDDGLTLSAGTSSERKWPAVRHVRSIAEPVASPADIVLADLDGYWHSAYRIGPERIGGLLAAFPDDPDRKVTDAFQFTAEPYEDFFLVNDGHWLEEPLPGGKRRFVFPGEPNAECTDPDRKLVNIMARPEISVGRINAYRAAFEPNPAIKGIKGEGLLDASGRPQAVEFADARSVPSAEALWVHSESSERRLLKEYFARNHSYRTGERAEAWRPASITTEWGSSVPDMKSAVPGWRDVATDGLDVKGAKVSAHDFVTWLTRPALARAVKAHAGPTGFGFDAPADPAAYEQLVGKGIWWWSKQGSKLVPELRPLGGWVSFGLLRTLYENRRLSGAPALYFHTGCEGITPAYYDKEPYNGPRHGLWQIAEAMLMYADGLALVGRGKVFYDEPREFWKVMGSGGTFGDAWRHYFDVEGDDGELAKDGIGRKRAYFWSTIGDCTLTLPAALRAPQR